MHMLKGKTLLADDPKCVGTKAPSYLAGYQDQHARATIALSSENGKLGKLKKYHQKQTRLCNVHGAA
jgi:hypothetical protein